MCSVQGVQYKSATGTSFCAVLPCTIRVELLLLCTCSAAIAVTIAADMTMRGTRTNFLWFRMWNFLNSLD